MEEAAEAEEEDADDGGADENQEMPWLGSDRDYHYEELLGRVFGILRERNPELGGERSKTVVKARGGVGIHALFSRVWRRS